MSNFSTPIRVRGKFNSESVTIPPSPFLKKLGYGSGVAVYKLERSPIANNIRSPWAIKKLIKTKLQNTDTFQHRLKQEADLLSKLKHPNIIGYRGFLTTKNKENCLAMEECSNCLGDMIEQRKDQDLEAFAAEVIMKVAMDIADALHYLHAQALILHSDVKSYNILIKGDFNICKLCDFGVSLPLTANGDVDFEKAGKDATYIGTRLWAAPEVLDFPKKITSKADIFSYGLVLWEMLALVPPRLDTLNENSDISDESMDTSYMSTESSDSMEISLFHKRPELPPQDLDDSYKYVLEIYHCCTETDPNLRLSALDLTISIPEMLKDMKLNVTKS